MKQAAKHVLNLLKQSVTDWSNDNCTSQAAAMSYYTVFSLAPLIIIAVAVAGLAFGRQAAQGQIQNQIQGLVGPSGAAVIESMVRSARKPSAGIVATCLGVIMLLLGASGVFVQLQQTLNLIWKAKPEEQTGFKNFARTRLLSFAMVLVIGFLLLVSLVLSAGLAAIGSELDRAIPGLEVTTHVINLLISFGVITVLFALIFKVLPQAKVRWSDVWLGAAVTSLLFSVGKFAIGLYLGKSSVASSYGAAGSIAIVLLWVYYSAMLLFFGAEFTHVYSKRPESRWAKRREEKREQKAQRAPGRAHEGSRWLPT